MTCILNLNDDDEQIKITHSKTLQNKIYNLSEVVGPLPCRGERACASLWSWEQYLQRLKPLAGLTKQIRSMGRDQIKMGPTSLSRGGTPTTGLALRKVGSLSRGLNTTQNKLKESRMEPKNNDHYNGKRYMTDRSRLPRLAFQYQPRGWRDRGRPRARWKDPAFNITTKIEDPGTPWASKEHVLRPKPWPCSLWWWTERMCNVDKQHTANWILGLCFQNIIDELHINYQDMMICGCIHRFIY
jgi:hypothetical protein